MIRLLLVDDHPSSRIPLALVLDREPDLSVVAQAGSVAEARRALGDLGSGEVDVALLDLDLPDGTGTDLIDDLRASNLEAKALVLTAASERTRLARAVEAEASGILNKMADMDEILNTLRRLAAGEQLMPPGEVLEMVRISVRQRERDRGARLALERLTARELEVLQALAEGLGDKEIAARLHVSAKTVRAHLTNMLNKLGVSSRLQALVFAARHGAVELRLPKTGSRKKAFQARAKPLRHLS
ncbi:MAG: response regulator transcription factor [Actinomycetota bacterium]|nr:response regulator transcription factor [Actinomycetota bacterium]